MFALEGSYTCTQTLSEKSKMASIWINHKIEIFLPAQDYDCVLLTLNVISNRTFGFICVGSKKKLLLKNPQNSWRQEQKWAHTFFLKFPSFKTTSRKEYSANQFHIFRESLFYRTISLFRSFVFVTELERRERMLMKQKM